MYSWKHSGKTYDEFMSSRGEQTTESVEKEMKKAEKVEVTSVNISDGQVTVKLTDKALFSHNTTIWAESNLCSN